MRSADIAPDATTHAAPASAGGVSLVTLTGLRKRADFLATARARHHATDGFVLQARQRDMSDGKARVGFTCSKKVGNAVARNRAKRRLRALARAVLPTAARPGWDYVLIGRAGSTASRSFTTLQDDLGRALKAVHAPRRSRTPRA